MNEMIIWSPGVTLEQIEKQVILKAFRFYRANKTATANALGIAVRTLDNKLEKYEADGKAEKERVENAKRHHEQYLARARGGGQQPNNVFTAGKDDSGANAAHLAAQTERRNGVNSESGVRMESVANTAPEQVVSVPKRQEVQGVLPGHAAKSGPNKAR